MSKRRDGNELPDPSTFIGARVSGDFELVEFKGAGKIGQVFRAYSPTKNLTYACKVILQSKLKKGWERELEKIRELQNVPNVVQYRDHGAGISGNNLYCWVLYDFVDGWNLNEFAEQQSDKITVPFIVGLLKCVLEVLYACKVQGIVHGDLHAGNILIGKPDPRRINARETINVNDFGYGGSHNDVQPKNDFKELTTFVSKLLRGVPQHSLNPADKQVHEGLQAFCGKSLADTARQAPGFNAGRLYRDLEDLVSSAIQRSSSGFDPATNSRRMPADYLVAEALGLRIEEWKDLFVPDFLAVNNLLSRNITVLTGARGCGKTMTFRRLTKLMDVVIGESSGVDSSEQFIGFYLNSRDIIDAFPWVPDPLPQSARAQVTHFFHLAWISEFIRTIQQVDSAEKKEEGAMDYSWLESWFLSYYGGQYARALEGESVAAHVAAFVETEKERCRASALGRVEHWELARIDVLDSFCRTVQSNVQWTRDYPLYLFLDDYTVPLVPRAMQRTLNSVIFKRRDMLFFKISTESATSFVATGHNDKQLELHHDFELLDLATESLHQKLTDKMAMLNRIFVPRIRRHALFAQKSYGLTDLLGETPYSNNALATKIRAGRKSGEDGKVLYHGTEVFANLWTSDVRTLVEMLTEMLRQAESVLSAQNCRIPPGIQDDRIRTQGGELMTFTQSIRDYDLVRALPDKRRRAERFGKHLKDVVEAFIGASHYELTKGKLIDNQGRLNPRQAFRLEVIDSFNPSEAAEVYLEGLIRYHIFLQDWRGKSQRGMLTPRLYLNRIFLPHGGLTLSSKDHIQVTNAELNLLLERPSEFKGYWKKKRGNGHSDGQIRIRY